MGRPIEVDSETLEFITPVGRNAEWPRTVAAPIEPMIAVAAHPQVACEESALYFSNFRNYTNYELIPLSDPSGERQLSACRWEGL